MRSARIVLTLSALAFGGFGLAFLVAPAAIAALVDIELRTATARAEVLAMYGGFEIGVAGFLLLCLRHDSWVRPGLVLSGCALAGFAAARLGGILTATGDVKPLMYGVLATEVLGTRLSFWAAGRASRR